MTLTPLTGTLELRRYRPADADATRWVFHQAIHRLARQDYTQDQVEAWAPEIFDHLAWAQARHASITWVAERNDMVIGFGDLMPDEFSNGLVGMLFVHPNYERQGVGSSLLEEIEQSAVDLRLQRLQANVSLTACSRFSQAGFETIGAQNVLVRGQSLINFRMEKWLIPTEF